MAVVFSVFLRLLGSFKTGLIWSALILKHSNAVQDIVNVCDLWNLLAYAILDKEKACNWLGCFTCSAGC